jgi:hypothetical protein
MGGFMARKQKERLPRIDGYYKVVRPILRGAIKKFKERIREMEAEATNLERVSRQLTMLSWAEGRPDPEAAVREFEDVTRSVMILLQNLSDRFWGPEPQLIIREVPVVVRPEPSIN